MLGAKLFFLVVGFVQQPLLRLAVGLSDFGGLAQALVVANTVNNVVIARGTQGVSRVVAGARATSPRPCARRSASTCRSRRGRGRDGRRGADLRALRARAGRRRPAARARGWRCSTASTRRSSDTSTAAPLRRQALLDVTFATLRTVGLIGVGYAFVTRGLSGVLGTTVGWVAAAALIVPLAARRPASEGPREGPAQARRAHGVPPGRVPRMLLPIAGAQLCTNVLMQIDIVLLGRFLSEGAASGRPGAQRDAVKEWVAIYRECQTFAFLPYQLLFSVTLILFPMLARARAKGDEEAVRGTSRGGAARSHLRGLLVGVVVAMPESMLSFAYGAADARRGADVLRTMALAQGAFAMLGIATTVLTSLGRERTAALVTLGAVIAVGVACAVLVPGAPSGTTSSCARRRPRAWRSWRRWSSPARSCERGRARSFRSRPPCASGSRSPRASRSAS